LGFSRFDKDLMYARGYAMGEEFKGKGVHVALGPMTNMGEWRLGGSWYHAECNQQGESPLAEETGRALAPILTLVDGLPK
jgi:beta-glucosidase-like glycosyl hydrolase